jgi:hypothetical protein
MEMYTGMAHKAETETTNRDGNRDENRDGIADGGSVGVKSQSGPAGPHIAMQLSVGGLVGAVPGWMSWSPLDLASDGGVDASSLGL